MGFFIGLFRENVDIKKNKITVLDKDVMKRLRELNRTEEYWILTFYDLVSKGDVDEVMMSDIIS